MKLRPDFLAPNPTIGMLARHFRRDQAEVREAVLAMLSKGLTKQDIEDLADQQGSEQEQDLSESEGIGSVEELLDRDLPLDMRQAAAVLQMTPNTLQKLMKRDRSLPKHPVGGQYRFFVSELKEWVRSKEGRINDD